MARLSDIEKRAIVRLLAHFTPTAQVVVIMRDEFDVQVDRFQVRSYDPTSPRYEAGERLRAIFETERQAFLKSMENIPVANKAYRLNMIQRLFDRAMSGGNFIFAAKLLEQAAKEEGGALTNEQKVQFNAGEGAWRETSLEERRAAVARLFEAQAERLAEEAGRVLAKAA